VVEGDVRDGVHHPHREGALGRRSVDRRRQPIVGPLQRAAQVTGLQGGHRHALPEGGVEAGHRVAEGDDAVREAVELVVAAPPAGREGVKRTAARFAGMAGSSSRS
jgi:hypothetical protein